MANSSPRSGTQTVLTPFRWGLIAVFCLAVLVRLALVFGFEWDEGIVDSYDVIAINLVEGRGFSLNGVDPTICRGPVYPHYLALLIRLFHLTDSPYVFFRIFDSVLDAITAVTLAIAYSLWFPRLRYGAAIGAGILFAANPFMAYYTVFLGSETLAVFFFAAYITLLHPTFVAFRSGLGWPTLQGLLGGILILNKSVFLPVVLVSPALLWVLSGRHLRTAAFFRRASMTLIISGVVVAPWVVRNTVLADKFVFTQTLTGFNFWYDFSMDRNRNQAVASGDLSRSYRGDPVLLPDGTPYHPYSLDPATDAAYDNQQVAAAIDWCKAEPGRFVVKVLDNLAAFWFQVETPAKMAIAGTFSLLLFCLAFWGGRIAAVAGHRKECLFFLLLIGVIVLTYSPVMSKFRYSLVTYPMLTLLGGASLYRLAECSRKVICMIGTRVRSSIGGL